MQAVPGKTYDVAVVGAGVFGAWTAYQLQRSGKRVVLLDAYGAGNSRSSSGDESRIIRMGYGADEIYTRSAQRSLQLWRDLFERTQEPLFQPTGVLWLAHAGDPYPVQTLETLNRVGVAAEKLTLDDLRRRYPQFAIDGISWALHEPESGVLIARRAVHAVVRAAINDGVECVPEAVQSPEHYGQIDRLRTIRGTEIFAGAYVFACGAWLPKVFPELLAHRINATRQEVFYFGTLAGNRFRPPQLPTWIDFQNEAYGLPDIEGRGVKVAIDRHGASFDPDTGDRIVSGEGLTEVRRYLARRLPDLAEAPVNETRVCQYENTSNGDFLVDRHPQFENIWLVGGGSGHGFKHGPFVGEYVAARIDGLTVGIEPRFSLTTKSTTRERAVY